MPRSYSQFYRNKRKYLSEQVDKGIVLESNAEAIRELCDAFDEDVHKPKKPDWNDAPSNLTSHREDSTLANWCYYCTNYAQEIDLLNTSADTLNEISLDWITDEDDGGGTEHKDGGLKKSTVRAYQNSLRIFYRYWDDVGVDFNDIQVFEIQSNNIESRDMLTTEEIEELRQAPTHPRDQAIIDLLIYTGMRNRALRTLRIKDVDLENDRFYFNGEVDGLKNIHKRSAPRPLLGAKGAVQDWLKYHPDPDNREAYLITGKPSYTTPNPEEPVSDRTIQRVQDSAKEEAGITKDLHPHMMRHNMVSLAKNEYDLDDATIKFLIGHAPDSQVMETTYSHISGEEYSKKAERKMGLRDDEEESSLTPDYCNICNEPLPSNAKACPRCGATYTPDAHTTQQQVKDDMYEAKGEVETNEEQDALDAMKELLDENPELLEKLTD